MKAREERELALVKRLELAMWRVFGGKEAAEEALAVLFPGTDDLDSYDLDASTEIGLKLLRARDKKESARWYAEWEAEEARRQRKAVEIE